MKICVDPAPKTENDDALRAYQQRQLKILGSKLKINCEISKDDPVDHIFIIFHGIGATDCSLASDYKMLKYTIDSVRRHWFYRQRIRIHLHVTNWKKYIIDAQNTLFDNVCIDTVKDARRFMALTMMDISFYYNPKYSDFLLSNVARDVNTEITRLRKHSSGRFKDSKIVLIGSSLGSVIIHELLCGVPDRLSNLDRSERPKLEHKVDYFFAVGSPLACSLVYQTPKILTKGLSFPEDVRCLNIFHPYDPIACRWERLIYRDLKRIPDPVILPFWQNNGFRNWHDWDKSMQQAKSLIFDNITDVASSIRSIFGWLGQSEKNSVLESNVTTADNRRRAFEKFLSRLKYPSRLDALENFEKSFNADKKEESPKVDEERTASEKRPFMTDSDVLLDNKKSDDATLETDDELLSDEEIALRSSSALTELNAKSGSVLPVRYDFQLQEDAAEHYLNPLAILQSHTNYWGSKDVAFFILETISKNREVLSVSSLLSSIKKKAKRIAMKAVDDEMRKKFLDLVEHAERESERLTNEDLKMKSESTTTLASTWTVLTKTAGSDAGVQEWTLSDPID